MERRKGDIEPVRKADVGALVKEDKPGEIVAYFCKNCGTVYSDKGGVGKFTAERCSVKRPWKGDLTRYMGFGSDGLGAWDYVAFRCPCCFKHNSVQVSGAILDTLPGRSAQLPPGGEPYIAEVVVTRG